MIRDKRIIISLGIILLLVLYLLIANRTKKSGEIPDIKPFKSADEILLKKDGKEIRIYSKDNKWFINEGYPADKSKIDNLEKYMKELTITDYISKGPYYIKYDLTPEKAVRAVFRKDEKIQRDILIGKASSTFRNTYIKFADDEKIYLASGNLRDEYSKDVDDLRDKQIYKVGREEIERFGIMYQGNKITLEKKVEQVEPDKDAKEKDKQANKEKTEKWICLEFKNVNIDKNKVDSFLESVALVNADSFSGKNKKDPKGQICSFTARVYNKDIELVINKKEGENYLCSSSESPYVFTLQEFNAKKFFKKLADFQEDKKNGKGK